MNLMTENSERPRGAGGKFISKEQAANISEEDLPELIHKSSKMTGALKDLKEAKEQKELEEPLVSVKINNPFTRILKWLNEVKKKQTTTFTFRLGVPLIALPVLVAAFAGVFFGLGKVTTKPTETVVDTTPLFYTVSKAGRLKIILTQGTQNYYLIMPSGEAIKLTIPANINMEGLDGKRILATGKFYTKDQLIVVENLSGLEVLPVTPKPLPTQVPTTAPTLGPTGETAPSPTL